MKCSGGVSLVWERVVCLTGTAQLHTYLYEQLGQHIFWATTEQTVVSISGFKYGFCLFLSLGDQTLSLQKSLKVLAVVWPSRRAFLSGVTAPPAAA